MARHDNYGNTEDFGHQGGFSGGDERRHAPPLYTEKIFSDRKIFFMDLKENDRGRFLKITEDVRGRRDTILLPVEALEDFIDALENVAEFHETGGVKEPAEEGA